MERIKGNGYRRDREGGEKYDAGGREGRDSSSCCGFPENKMADVRKQGRIERD